jgi:hypothetical protein
MALFPVACPAAKPVVQKLFTILWRDNRKRRHLAISVIFTEFDVFSACVLIFYPDFAIIVTKIIANSQVLRGMLSAPITLSTAANIDKWR